MPDISTRFSTCIDDFVSVLAKRLGDNVRAVVLHGGLVRDPAPIERWSDIDLIVVLRHYSDRVTPTISELVEHLEHKNGVRLDINLLYESDLASERSKARFYHSEIINALNHRGTRVLYGTTDVGDVSLFDEDEAVYIYLNTVMNLFRRYYIENIYRPAQLTRNAADVQRIIRWVFSIIRSSLRLRGIYVNPYHESLGELIRLNLASPADVQLLKSLIGIRGDLRAFDSLTDAQVRELYASVEEFVERYVHGVVDQS